MMVTKLTTCTFYKFNQMAKLRRLVSATLPIRYQLNSVSTTLAKQEKSNLITTSILKTEKTPNTSLTSKSSNTILVNERYQTPKKYLMSTSCDTVFITQKSETLSSSQTSTPSPDTILDTERAKTPLASTLSSDSVLDTERSETPNSPLTSTSSADKVLVTGGTQKPNLPLTSTSWDSVLVSGRSQKPDSQLMSTSSADNVLDNERSQTSSTSSADTVLVNEKSQTPSTSSADTVLVNEKSQTPSTSSADTVLVNEKSQTPNSQIMSTSSDTVLVTGGSGFLGQHIIKLLQEKADHVKEIRILDIKPYKNILDYKQSKPIQTILGNITDRDTVQRACHGVTSVYHVAGLISYGVFLDINGMEQINIEGTRNVIDGCVRAGVQRLIYCSTVDVAIGYDPIRDGNEENTPPPKRFLFPGYPETKYKAECLVLESNGRTFALGRKLETLALRVNVLYGEGDPYYVTTGLKRAYKANGTLYRVGNGHAKFQQAYAGNAAWAFICADTALRNNSTPGGTVYYIPDNTPIQNTFDFFQPFLECRQLQLSKWRIPFSLVYGGLFLVEMFLHLISPFKKVYYREASCSVWYICMDLYFSGEKARKMLGYAPIIPPNEAISRSITYYQKINLDTNDRNVSATKET